MRRQKAHKLHLQESANWGQRRTWEGIRQEVKGSLGYCVRLVSRRVSVPGHWLVAQGKAQVPEEEVKRLPLWPGVWGEVQ